MTPYEWVAVGYFVGLSLAAGACKVPWRRRLATSAAGLVIALVVAVVAATGSDVLRAWAPHVYLVAGYWLPAMLAPRPAAATRFERWLVRFDAGFGLRAVPTALAQVSELAYLLCYPLIPAASSCQTMASPKYTLPPVWLARIAINCASTFWPTA